MEKKIELPTLQTPLKSTEIALHELGEGLAISIATVQNELARYPNELGSYVLDEVEITIPARLRVDKIGQLRVCTVNDAQDNQGLTKIHLRVRPVLGTTQSVPLSADKPLSALGDVLPSNAIKQLEELRVFSVEDFLRITRNTAGQSAVQKMLPDIKLNSVIDRATLFTLPDVTPSLAITLVQIGITSPMDLVTRDSKSLTEEINKQLEGRLDTMLTQEDVLNFQSSIRQLTKLRLPNK